MHEYHITCHVHVQTKSAFYVIRMNSRMNERADGRKDRGMRIEEWGYSHCPERGDKIKREARDEREKNRGTVIEKSAKISIVALSHVLHRLAYLFYLTPLPEPSKKADNNTSEAHSRAVTDVDLWFNEWLRKPGRLGALRSLHVAKRNES